MTRPSEKGHHVPNRHIGRLIAKRREELGLSHTDLAGRLGISKSELQNRENGGSDFSALELLQFAGALQVRPVWFLEGLTYQVAGLSMPDQFALR